MYVVGPGGKVNTGNLVALDDQLGGQADRIR